MNIDPNRISTLIGKVNSHKNGQEADLSIVEKEELHKRIATNAGNHSLFNRLTDPDYLKVLYAIDVRVERRIAVGGFPYQFKSSIKKLVGRILRLKRF